MHLASITRAVLFVDVRGFTAMAERMSPEDLARFLTEFRSRTVRSIFACRGTVDDKFWAMARSCSPSSARSARVEEPARSALHCIEDIPAAMDCLVARAGGPAAKLRRRVPSAAISARR